MIDKQSFYCEYKIVTLFFFANWNEKSNPPIIVLLEFICKQTNPYDCGVQ